MLTTRPPAARPRQCRSARRHRSALLCRLIWSVRDQAARLGWCFPYLQDEAQETAREFHAACTPDIYLFDRDLSLVYHGQFDETRPYRASDQSAGVVKDDRIHQQAHGADLRRAIENLLAGKPPLGQQTPCLGCNIKWHTAT